MNLFSTKRKQKKLKNYYETYVKPLLGDTIFKQIFGQSIDQNSKYNPSVVTTLLGSDIANKPHIQAISGKYQFDVVKVFAYVKFHKKSISDIIDNQKTPEELVRIAKCLVITARFISNYVDGKAPPITQAQLDADVDLLLDITKQNIDKLPNPRAGYVNPAEEYQKQLANIEKYNSYRARLAEYYNNYIKDKRKPPQTMSEQDQQILGQVLDMRDIDYETQGKVADALLYATTRFGGIKKYLENVIGSDTVFRERAQVFAIVAAYFVNTKQEEIHQGNIFEKYEDILDKDKPFPEPQLFLSGVVGVYVPEQPLSPVSDAGERKRQDTMSTDVQPTVHKGIPPPSPRHLGAIPGALPGKKQRKQVEPLVLDNEMVAPKMSDDDMPDYPPGMIPPQSPRSPREVVPALLLPPPLAPLPEVPALPALRPISLPAVSSAQAVPPASPRVQRPVLGSPHPGAVLPPLTTFPAPKPTKRRMARKLSAVGVFNSGRRPNQSAPAVLPVSPRASPRALREPVQVPLRDGESEYNRYGSLPQTPRLPTGTNILKEMTGVGVQPEKQPFLPPDDRTEQESKEEPQTGSEEEKEQEKDKPEIKQEPEKEKDKPEIKQENPKEIISRLATEILAIKVESIVCTKPVYKRDAYWAEPPKKGATSDAYNFSNYSIEAILCIIKKLQSLGKDGLTKLLTNLPPGILEKYIEFVKKAQEVLTTYGFDMLLTDTLGRIKSVVVRETNGCDINVDDMIRDIVDGITVDVPDDKKDIGCIIYDIQKKLKDSKERLKLIKQIKSRNGTSGLVLFLGALVSNYIGEDGTKGVKPSTGSDTWSETEVGYVVKSGGVKGKGTKIPKMKQEVEKLDEESKEESKEESEEKSEEKPDEKSERKRPFRKRRKDERSASPAPSAGSGGSGGSGNTLGSGFTGLANRIQNVFGTVPADSKSEEAVLVPFSGLGMPPPQLPPPPTQPPPSPPTGTKNLNFYLVKDSISCADSIIASSLNPLSRKIKKLSKRFSDKTDDPLSTFGYTIAKNMIKPLIDTKIKPDIVISGMPLKTIQTAQIVYPDKNVYVFPYINYSEYDIKIPKKMGKVIYSYLGEHVGEEKPQRELVQEFTTATIKEKGMFGVDFDSFADFFRKYFYTDNKEIKLLSSIGTKSDINVVIFYSHTSIVEKIHKTKNTLNYGSIVKIPYTLDLTEKTIEPATDTKCPVINAEVEGEEGDCPSVVSTGISKKVLQTTTQEIINKGCEGSDAGLSGVSKLLAEEERKQRIKEEKDRLSEELRQLRTDMAQQRKPGWLGLPSVTNIPNMFPSVPMVNMFGLQGLPGLPKLPKLPGLSGFSAFPGFSQVPAQPVITFGTLPKEEDDEDDRSVKSVRVNEEDEKDKKEERKEKKPKKEPRVVDKKSPEKGGERGKPVSGSLPGSHVGIPVRGKPVRGSLPPVSPRQDVSKKDATKDNTKKLREKIQDLQEKNKRLQGGIKDSLKRIRKSGSYQSYQSYQSLSDKYKRLEKRVDALNAQYRVIAPNKLPSIRSDLENINKALIAFIKEVKKIEKEVKEKEEKEVEKEKKKDDGKDGGGGINGRRLEKEEEEEEEKEKDEEDKGRTGCTGRGCMGTNIGFSNKRPVGGRSGHPFIRHRRTSPKVEDLPASPPASPKGRVCDPLSLDCLDGGRGNKKEKGNKKDKEKKKEDEDDGSSFMSALEFAGM